MTNTRTPPPGTGPQHNPRDPRLRIRVWVNRTMQAEEWINAADPGVLAAAEALRDTHESLVAAAHAEGLPWLVEIYDPAEPPASAYLRFGTDTAMMTCPLALALDDALRLALAALLQAVIAGEHDASQAEADDWARSAEGQAALRELHGG